MRAEHKQSYCASAPGQCTEVLRRRQSSKVTWCPSNALITLASWFRYGDGAEYCFPVYSRTIEADAPKLLASVKDIRADAWRAAAIVLRSIASQMPDHPLLRYKRDTYMATAATLELKVPQ